MRICSFSGQAPGAEGADPHQGPGLDEREAAGGTAMVEAAQALKATREAKGIGDSYQTRHGSQPSNDALLGERIEVILIVHYTLPEGVFGER